MLNKLSTKFSDLKLKSRIRLKNMTKSKSKLNIVFDIAIYICFAALFFSIPTCSFTPSLNLITWGFTILELLLMVLSLFLFYDFKFNLISASFILFAISVLISSGLNGFVNFVATPIYLSIFSLLIYTYCLGNKSAKKPLLLMTYIGTIAFLFVFIAKYSNELIHFNFDRLGRIFGDENDIAIFMSFGMVLSFYIFMSNKNIFIKILSFLLFLLFSYCGVSSGSKIFVLIFLVCIILTIFLHFGLKKWWLSLIIVCGLIGVCILLINLPFMSTLKTRIDSFLSMFFSNGNSSTKIDYSTLDRFEMFKFGFNMFLRKPLFGYGSWGFANFGDFNNGWSHNQFSETLCNFGLVGTIFFHCGYVYAIYCYFKCHQKDKYQLPFIMLVFYLCMMFSVALNSQKFYSFTIGIVITFFKEPETCFKFCFPKLQKWRKLNEAN